MKVLLLLPTFVVGLTRVTTETETPLGVIDTVCDVDRAEGPVVYIEIDRDVWEESVNYPGFAGSVPVPVDCPPFDHVFISYSPVGHPAFDGKGGGYGVPHYDVHFEAISIETREALTGSCVTGDVPVQCDPGNETNFAFFNLPPPEYTMGFYSDDTFGNHAIINHGLHMLPESDAVPGGPAVCESTGPFGNWIDCAVQYGTQFAPTGFQDFNCSCGDWVEGVSEILNVFDGKVIAFETMVAVDHYQKIENGALDNPHYRTFPRSPKSEFSGYVPESTYTELTNSTIRLGLAFDVELAQACSVDCAYRRRRNLKFGFYSNDECAGC